VEINEDGTVVHSGNMLDYWKVLVMSYDDWLVWCHLFTCWSTTTGTVILDIMSPEYLSI
jgi:hypothetical protein